MAPIHKVCALLSALSGFAMATSGCAQHAQTNAGLDRALARSEQQAEQERSRVLALEARLLQLEYAAALARSQGEQTPPRSNTDQLLVEKIDRLVQLNQSLIDRSLAEQRAATYAAPPAPVQAQAQHLGSECGAGLTTEQKIRQLVLELRGERSPWRVDGLSYEESEALRFLLREERQLDRRNPWQ